MIAWVVGGGTTVVGGGLGGLTVSVVGGGVGGPVEVETVVVVVVVVRVVVVVVVVGVVVVVVVVGVVVVVVVVVGDVVVVVEVGDVVLVAGTVVVVVGVTVETVGSPLLPVTVIVCGTGGGTSPGLVTRVVVVVGVLSVLVRVMARPPTVAAANAAAIPNSNGGLRYQGNGAEPNSIPVSGSISTVGRESVCGTV